MGTSCTKSQKKKRSTQIEQPMPPPIFISEEAGLSPYNPKPVQEIDEDDVVIRILTPEPSPLSSSHASEIIVADERSAGSLEEQDNDPGQTEEVIDVSQQGPQGSGPDDDVVSVQSSRTAEPRSTFSVFSFLRRDNTDTRAGTKNAKHAAHPSRKETIEDFSKPQKEDKDFPTEELDRIKEVVRDRLPLDILTRRTKILNSLKTKMSSLEKLELRHCKLNTFPSELKSTSIKQLNFSDNLISELPPKVFSQLLSLELLNISQNLLQSLPEDIAKCTNLKELLVDRNQIKEVTPQMLVGLTNLRVLNLMHNRMERMTFTLDVIPNVKELNCSKNLIGVVTDDFFGSTGCELEVFKLSHNPLKDIGTKVLNLPNLLRLDIRQTHIGKDHPTFVLITQQTGSDGKPKINCLVHQLIAFEETSTPQPVVEEKPLSPAPPAEVKEEKKDIADVEKHRDEDRIADETKVPIKEPPYDYPPETSILHIPLRDLVLQINDNLHITLTVATIEKIVRQGLDAKEKGVLVLNVPLTSNYFMERIARYPSAINVLSAFKYHIRDDPHKGLILQPSAEFNSSRKRETKKVGKKPPLEEKSESKSEEQKPKLQDDTIEDLLAALIKFKQSVGTLVEKEFDVPDFNAYVKENPKQLSPL